MSRQEYLNKIFELSVDLRETEKQIAGLYNRKNQIQKEMDNVMDLMVEEARSGKLYEEE